MGDKIYFVLVFLVLLLQERNMKATGSQLCPSEPTKSSKLNPLEKFLFNENQQNGTNSDKDYNENHSRVKRQYYYGRDRYYPLPIIVGGGAYPAFGPRGFGGRGYGGRGIAGRGFGGRGIGGRGIGGRGIGGRGIGGRGGIGGGRGGRG